MERSAVNPKIPEFSVAVSWDEANQTIAPADMSTRVVFNQAVRRRPARTIPVTTATATIGTSGPSTRR